MMTDWIFLSKDGKDEYINAMAQAARSVVTSTNDFVYESSHCAIVLRGILKHKIMQRCWAEKRDFYYMDTGYFGNTDVGKKLWHRVVKNNLQHDAIIPRPRDRWQKFNINLHPRRHGRRIILAAPDDKPCKFYGIDRERWIIDTVDTIRRHTDREIVIRHRAPQRQQRLISDPLARVLCDDVHALVTFNSVAATESIMLGVPAFVLAPSNAAAPVANQDLSSIDNPYWADEDKLHAWACHLAYGQFHVRELRDGTAQRILENTP